MSASHRGCVLFYTASTHCLHPFRSFGLEFSMAGVDPLRKFGSEFSMTGVE
jgi:hypothetical protein